MDENFRSSILGINIDILDKCCTVTQKRCFERDVQIITITRDLKQELTAQSSANIGVNL